MYINYYLLERRSSSWNCTKLIPISWFSNIVVVQIMIININSFIRLLHYFIGFWFTSNHIKYGNMINFFLNQKKKNSSILINYNGITFISSIWKHCLLLFLNPSSRRILLNLANINQNMYKVQLATIIIWRRNGKLFQNSVCFSQILMS